MQFYTSAHLRHDNLLLRGFSSSGERIKEKIPLKPYLFIPSKTGNTPYRTINGKPVDRLDFDSASDAREFVKQYKEVNNFPIYGLTNFVYPCIRDMFPNDIDYDPKLISVVTIDIETDSEGGFPNVERADKAITAITISRNGQKRSFGLFPYTTTRDDVKYTHCATEVDLLHKFIFALREWDPDVLTGWNIEMFDVPYLVNRIRHVIDEKTACKLSPWGILEDRTVEMFGRETTIYSPVGVAILDYLALYKKFSYSGQQESYSLQYIATKELGVGKLDYVAEGYESLHDLYTRNFQKYIDYNIIDSERVDQLEDKLKFLEQVFAIAYDAKVNYNDAFTSVRIWDVIIHNHLIEKNIVIPNNFKRFVKDEPIVGAYVKDPRPGAYKWVVSFDLDSLYPHLIMQYNISPETFRRKDDTVTIESLLHRTVDEGVTSFCKENNLALAASGCMFDRDLQGFLPYLMETMYNDRVTFKKKMIEAKKVYEKDPTYENKKAISRHHNMQLAKKVQLNSVYGALSNIYFRWFDTDLAESITKSGQLSIRWIEEEINQKLNKLLETEKVDYVIACDTDSMYISFDDVIRVVMPDEKDTTKIINYLDKISNTYVKKIIDDAYTQLAEYVNAYAQKMRMKRENIADKGIWTGKKHYILNVYDSEGVRYAQPELKIMGIEAVRSSTPAACRSSIKEALKLIMSTDEETVIKFIEEFRDRFKNLPYEDIAFPRSVSGTFEGQQINKDGQVVKQGYASSSTIYIKGTPIATKGTLIYNHMVKKLGLESKLPLINEGEKVKFAYLKVPNPTGCTVIATPGTLPPQLGLEKYIHYDEQFERGFLEPIRKILSAVGWKTEKQNTLDQFFG